MKIELIAVGKGMPDWVRLGLETYVQRLSPEFEFKLIEITAITRNKGMSQEKAKTLEGEKMINAIGKGCQVVALDVKGAQWSTERFSSFLNDCRSNINRLVFLIGGADGLSATCLQKANRTLSLSALTFPHMLVRVLLAEQLYRGLSILRNHPYHRA